MSIGNLMSWNFVDRVRNRDFQYILLCVSSEEMKYCKVSGNNTLMKWKCSRCTVELQPSDVYWQSWVINELN
ncbi:hypothetical protein pdam_00024981 [Pocillopora damicornis]|uniref:Uncharacterized protein n=1 Tax=Pocillopora damicornis TaxID=46731 RepID=A0A3M6URP9_POCDA|nr:hypothetical protein pdam_00024981 [Pocillopora damicornis]